MLQKISVGMTVIWRQDPSSKMLSMLNGLLAMDTIQLEYSELTTHMHKCINRCVFLFRPEMFMIVKV